MPSQREWNTYAEPRSAESPQMSAQGFESTIIWDPSWGIAFGAALLPLIPSPSDARQLNLRVGGLPIRRPQPSQVEMNWRLFRERPTEAIAHTPPIPWPEGASFALLMLLFKSPNPSHPSHDNSVRLMSRLRTIFEFGSTWVAAAMVAPPTESDAKGAVAWYLREYPVSRTSVGVVLR